MGQHMVGDLEAASVTSKARLTSGSVAVTAAVFSTSANYETIAALDARLTAISGTIYPQRILDQMTSNDKIFAVRTNDDLTTI